jgi:hypothetical protein
MKIIFLVLFILLLSNISQSQDKVFSTKEKRKEFLKELTLKHGESDCRYIFNSDKTFEFEQWLDGNKESILIEDYPTVIHELFHGICESSDSYQILYLDSAYLTKYNYDKAFNSKELNSIVRKGLQDSIFRYGIYVAGSNKLPDGTVDKRLDHEAASVGYGIYGMFEEFCAYYHGAKASFLLYDYYEQNMAKKTTKPGKII